MFYILNYKKKLLFAIKGTERARERKKRDFFVLFRFVVVDLLLF